MSEQSARAALSAVEELLRERAYDAKLKHERLDEAYDAGRATAFAHAAMLVRRYREQLDCCCTAIRSPHTGLCPRCKQALGAPLYEPQAKP